MKRTLSLTLLGLAVGVLAAGCGPNSAATTTATTTTTTTTTQTGQGPGGGAQAHPDEGPHDGHLIELGDHEYHAELMHQHDSHTVAVFLFDGHVENPVAIAEPEITIQLLHDGEYVTYSLKAVAEPGVAEGKASQFRCVDEELCHAIGEDEELKGSLQVTIDGKQYTGKIAASHGGDADHPHPHP